MGATRICVSQAVPVLMWVRSPPAPVLCFTDIAKQNGSQSKQIRILRSGLYCETANLRHCFVVVAAIFAVVIVVGVVTVLFCSYNSAHKVIETVCGLSPHCMSIGCVCNLHQFHTTLANLTVQFASIDGTLRPTLTIDNICCTPRFK